MQPPQKKNWWERNWKWVVPVGCLGALAVVAVFAVTIIFFVFGLMKSSDVYQDAVARAKAAASVQAAIGTPVEEGLFVTGNINTSGSSGHADLAIPIAGPDGEATLYVVAEKAAGRWTMLTLVVVIEATEERIDLLE